MKARPTTSDQAGNRRLFLELMRYGFVGLAVTLLYMLLTSLLIELGGLPALAGSIGGFALALPAAYLGHKHVTFNSSGGQPFEITRFAVTMSSSFLISTTSIVVVVNLFAAHYGVALIITAAIVPLFNFVVLKRWVFQ